MAIFLPLAFMKGLVGKFLFQFGVVLSVAVAFSLLEALTITPARCAQILNLKAGSNPIGRAVDRLMHGMAVVYQRMLGPTLKFRYVVLLAASAIFALTIPMSMRLLSKFEMVPPQDQSRFMLQLRTPVGSSIDYTDARCRLVEDFLAARPEVNRFYMSIGGFSGGEVDSAASFITLKPPGQRKLSQKQFIDECRKELNKIPGLLAIPFDPRPTSPAPAAAASRRSASTSRDRTGRSSRSSATTSWTG
jgi:HAE1 family hydrophobic/amphiphilic exporter-1